MEEEVLKDALVMAVEYYFAGLDAKEAINKAIEETRKLYNTCK